MDDEKPLSLAQQLRNKLGLKKSYAYALASGARKPPLELALQIHDATGAKLGALANATDEQVAVLAELQGKAA